MEWMLEVAFKYPRRFVVAIGLALVGVAIFLLWQLVWQNPARVFDDMLANNVAMQSVTKHIVAGTDQQGVDELIRLQMGSTNAADWVVTARQTGASVATDSIGTPTTGYIRYTQIATMGNKAQFERVLNQWAKVDGKVDASLEQLFSNTVLDINSAPTPPIANLPVAQRENLLTFIRGEKVFTPDYTKLKQETVNGRSVITYTVSVKLNAYVRLMQAFAHDLGIKSLDNVDPSQYSGLQPVTMMMSVDRFSHQLVRITYPSSGFVEGYSDWGLLTPVELPDHAISTTELQSRLQADAGQK